MKNRRPRVPRPLTALALTLTIGLPAWSGCGPELSPSELGEVHFEIPKVPGAESAYVLPEPSPKADTPGEPAGE